MSSWQKWSGWHRSQSILLPFHLCSIVHSALASCCAFSTHSDFQWGCMSTLDGDSLACIFFVLKSLWNCFGVILEHLILDILCFPFFYVLILLTLACTFCFSVSTVLFLWHLSLYFFKIFLFSCRIFSIIRATSHFSKYWCLFSPVAYFSVHSYYSKVYFSHFCLFCCADLLFCHNCGCCKYQAVYICCILFIFF